MTLPCLIKWAMSVTASLVAPILALTLFAVIIVGCGIAFDWGWNRIVARVPLDTIKTIVRWKQYSTNAALVCFAIFLVGVCCFPLAANVMEKYFGCDTCLPAFLQTECTAINANQEARDRAIYEALREKYGWTN